VKESEFVNRSRKKIAQGRGSNFVENKSQEREVFGDGVLQGEKNPHLWPCIKNSCGLEGRSLEKKSTDLRVRKGKGNVTANANNQSRVLKGKGHSLEKKG